MLDPQTEDQLFFVDGKIGIRPKADVQSADGTVLYQVRGRLLGIPTRMDVTDAGGNQYAHLHAQAFKFVKDKIDVTLATGEEWLLEGDVIEKNYTVNDSAGRHVIQISQKWITSATSTSSTSPTASSPPPPSPWSGPSTAGSSATDYARQLV